MASLFKRTVRVTDLTTGKTVKRKTARWYGKYVDGDAITRRVALCKDKTAAQTMLNELVLKADRTKAGIVDVFEAHRKRPLAEHIADFEANLRHRGGTVKHARQTTGYIQRVFDGCQYRFLADISASDVQSFLDNLGRVAPLHSIPEGIESFTLEDLAKHLHVKKASIGTMIARHGLPAEGNGKKRRYPRETLLALIEKRPQGLNRRSINSYLTAVKAFCRWCVKDRRMSDNPLGHLAGLDFEHDRRLNRRAISTAEAARLFHATERSLWVFRGLVGQDRAMIYALALGTGLRKSELASLKPEDFDLAADVPLVTVAPRNTKNRRQALQPIPSGLVPRLRSYLASKPRNARLWPGTWVDRAAWMLHQDLKAIGIKPVTEEGNLDLHSLRHSYITWLVASGTPPKLAQQLARHSDINLTMNVYTHLTLHDAHGAVEKLPSILAGPPAPERLALPKTGTDDNSVAPDLAPTNEVLRLRLRSDEETKALDADAFTERKSLGPKTLADECGDMRVVDKSTPDKIRTCDRRIRNQNVAVSKANGSKKLRQLAESMAPDLAPQDSELALLIAHWPTLPSAIRAGILGMVKSFT